MGIDIRKAFPEDALEFALCHISCWQTAYKEIVPDEFLDNMLTEKQQRIDKYKKVLNDPGECEYYCVNYYDRMIGFLIINKNLNADYFGIWAIYLIEEFCGKGYGKEIISFAINELMKLKPDEIPLWVFEENIRARRFYEKQGFYFNGSKREAFYGKPLMQLKYVLKVPN